MVFHWSLRDSKSPQVSRTLLSILAVLSNAVIWKISTRPPTSKSSRPFNNHLVIVPKAPITIGTIVTFMFHSFFNSLARSRYLSFFSHSLLLLLIFTPLEFFTALWETFTLALADVFPCILSDNKPPQVTRTLLSILSDLNYSVFWMVFTRPLFSKSPSPCTNQSPQFCKFSFLLLINLRSVRLAEIWWSVCISKSQRSLCISFFRTVSGLCIYHLFVWSNFNLLHIFHGSSWPPSRFQVLYSFCANSLHSLIMWLIVSSLSPHNLYLLFYCVLSILALIWLVFMTLFYAAIRRDSVSLKVPFSKPTSTFSRARWRLLVV